MTAITQALSLALLHFAWQGALVACLLWTALLFMKKRSANARYIVSCVALAVMLALPVMTAVVLHKAPAASQLSGEVLVKQTALVVMTSAPPSGWMVRVQSWALPVWALGVLLFSVRMVWGYSQVAVLRRSGEPGEGAVLTMVAELGRRMGIARPVRVLRSSLAEGPSVIGWIRPVILLPSATVLGLSAEQLEAVLAHELAHIRRYDYLVNALQIVVETLLFYHPAVWWVSGRIRHERELCCDDVAVSCCGDALCYARALTKLERLRIMTPGLAMGSTGGPLMYRIQRLMGVTSKEYGPSRLPGILTLCFALACLAVNMNWTRGQAQEVRKTTAVQVPDSSGVSVEAGNAEVLHRVPVRYPESAAKKHIQGTVVLEATTDMSGDVLDARVMSGPPELRKSALESVLNWHFKPGAEGTIRQVSITFQPPAGTVQAQVKPLTAERKGWAITTDHDQEKRDVQEEIRQLEAVLSQLREHYTDSYPDVQTVIERIEAARARRDQIAGDLGRLRVLLNPQTAERTMGTVKWIEVYGLTDELRNDLSSKLTVHVGDTLTSDAIEAAAKTVREFDEHLTLQCVPLDDGGAKLVIAPLHERERRRK